MYIQGCSEDVWCWCDRAVHQQCHPSVSENKERNKTTPPKRVGEKQTTRCLLKATPMLEKQAETIQQQLHHLIMVANINFKRNSEIVKDIRRWRRYVWKYTLDGMGERWNELDAEPTSRTWKECICEFLKARGVKRSAESFWGWSIFDLSETTQIQCKRMFFFEFGLVWIFKVEI